MSEMPVDTVTISPGTQTSGEVEKVDGTKLQPMRDLLHPADVFTGLVVSNPRSINQATLQMAAAQLNQSRNDREIASTRLSDQDKDLKGLREELGEAKTTIAVLRQQLGVSTKLQAMRGIAGPAGTLLATYALDVYKANMQVTGIATGIIGAMLIAFSLFGVPGRINTK